MAAANDLTAEFGGYQRSIESIDQGNAGVAATTDSIKVFISYADKGN